jgi:hypothetical protein
VVETEFRLGELEEERAIANRLATEEAERQRRRRIEEIEADADVQRKQEADAWGDASKAFAAFVAAASAHAQLVQNGLATRSAVQHEFANQVEQESLLAATRPAVYPVPRDLGDIVYLLSGDVDTSEARVASDGRLDYVDRSGDRPWKADQSWNTTFG